MVDSASQCWRLYKSSLSVTFASTLKSTAFAPEQWISAELLAIMESMSTRKIVVTEDSKQEPILLVRRQAALTTYDRANTFSYGFSRPICGSQH
jgi:glycerol-3-phosphate O-acyltransferase